MGYGDSASPGHGVLFFPQQKHGHTKAAVWKLLKDEIIMILTYLHLESAMKGKDVHETIALYNAMYIVNPR